MKTRYYAHSENARGKCNLLAKHLLGVSKLARKFAFGLGLEKESEIAGLLHDLGKYGDLFQKRLFGQESGIDHWSAGAWAAISMYKQAGIAIALAIQGHHLGLQQASEDAIRELDLRLLIRKHPLNKRLSESNLALLLDRLKADSIYPPAEYSRSIFTYGSKESEPTSSMMDIRMLFSTLVDADFIETAAHFADNEPHNDIYSGAGPELNPHKAHEVLLSYINKLAGNSTSAEQINQSRAQLLKDCLSAADNDIGTFTLSAPTGSGKTLSMMVFALKHAIRNNLKRVIIVIPYLSIIEQTARVLRSIFADKFGSEYIIEDHSLADVKSADVGIHGDEGIGYRAKLMAENWDAPVIITTSVQFLESIFSNRPFKCRKLHRIANSIVLFDEVQTLPTHAIVPTLATLSRICERYNSSIVFSTATQPAFNHLDQHVSKFCNIGWKPSEVVSDHKELFKNLGRVKITWPEDEKKVEWADLACQIANHQQVLCIVNLKRHAHTLIDEISKIDNEGLLHLSTNMCPAHRSEVLQMATDRLKNSLPCCLISTQCIEAGVDIDFPMVYRAFGPLDSIAQAAGRCNRNGNLEIGHVHLFRPDDKRAFPDNSYQQAAAVTNLLLNENGPDKMDINNPDLFEEYFRKLYSFRNVGGKDDTLIKAIKRIDFVNTAKEYYVIQNQDTIRVLVPYNRQRYDELKTALDENGLSKQWIQSAQHHGINMFRPKPDAQIWNWLIPAPIGPVTKGHRELSENWYVYIEPDHYDAVKGLAVPQDTDYIIA